MRGEQRTSVHKAIEKNLKGRNHTTRNKACTKGYIANRANAAIPPVTCSNMWTNRG